MIAKSTVLTLAALSALSLAGCGKQGSERRKREGPKRGRTPGDHLRRSFHSAMRARTCSGAVPP